MILKVQHLTLTSVVFEFHIINLYFTDSSNLTLTSVVSKSYY